MRLYRDVTDYMRMECWKKPRMASIDGLMKILKHYPIDLDYYDQN